MSGVVTSEEAVAGMTAIFRVADERPGWEGFALAVYRADDGAIHVYQEGSRGGRYPRWTTTQIPRAQVPGLIAALAESLL